MQPKCSLRRLVIVSIFIFSGLAFQSCDRREDSQEDLRIWAILPLTGPGAGAGEQAKESINAILQYHSARGADENVPKTTIKFLDSKSSPRDAISAFQQKLALGRRP